jgi:hypothetical protein
MENKNAAAEEVVKEFHFLNELDEVLGIETAFYKNGNQVKRVKLIDGREAIVRELYGRDAFQINKVIASGDGKSFDKEKYLKAMLHYSVKIDGKALPMEDFENLKLKDYNRIVTAVQSVNF